MIKLRPNPVNLDVTLRINFNPMNDSNTICIKHSVFDTGLDELEFKTNSPPEKAGIYVFTSLDEAITYYVGASFNLLQRLKSHKVASFLKDKNLEYKVMWALCGWPELTESEAIGKLKPLLNGSKNQHKDNSLRLEYSSKYLELKPLTTNNIITNIGDLRLAGLKLAGDALISIRASFQEAGASVDNPVETDMGTFTGFEDFLANGGSKVKKSAAYEYIKLAKNWDIVLKLGMQDTTNEKTLAKSMRLCRTLKIIDWYKEQLLAGRPEEELTLDAYWAEESAPTFNAGITKRQLELENNSLKQEVARLTAELNRLKESYYLT